MKGIKLISGMFIGGALALGLSSLLPTNHTSADDGVKVEVNGVEVQSEANHFFEGQIYVDVNEYLDMVGVEYDIRGKEKNQKVILDNKKEITNVVRHGSYLTAQLEELAIASGSDEITYQNESKSSVYVLDLPDGAVRYHPPMDGMGQHWIVLRDKHGEKLTSDEVDKLIEDAINFEPSEDGDVPEYVTLKESVKFPDSTIYGTWNGELIFIEQMVSIHGVYADEKFYESPHYYSAGDDPDNDYGKIILPTQHWTQLDGMEGKPSPAVDHTDMGVQPVGHPGFTVPHYDIHHYFISHEEHEQIEVHEEHIGDTFEEIMTSPIKEEYIQHDDLIDLHYTH